MKKTLESLNLLIKIFLISAMICCGSKDEDEFVDERTPVVKSDSVKNDGFADEKNTQKETDKGKYEKGNIKKESVVISPLETGAYLGKEVTVNGFIADIYRTERVAYLNFVEKYPDNPFTAVIFSSRFANFGDIDTYLNKNVEVTGRVSVFREKPQMILDSPSQIRIIE